MPYKFLPMNTEYAHEIAYQWKYDGVYAFYDITADHDDLREFLDENYWAERYFAVLNEQDGLVGYYLYTFEYGIMWIGFGLKPSLTGRGLGGEFVGAGIDFGVKRFGYTQNSIMLAVASFNHRAIKLYKKIGFKPIGTYMQKTNGGEYEFVKMQKML